MTDRRLDFGTGPLLGFGIGTALAAVGGWAFAIHVGREGEMRGVLRLLGPEGSYWVLMVCALFCAAIAAGLIRRLAGDRTAAAIRDDGVEIAGIFLSRVIPWRDLDRIYLRSYSFGGETYHYVKVDTRCRPAGANPFHHLLAELSYGTSVRLLEGGGGQAAAWVELARAERIEALRPRPAPSARGAAVEPAAPRPVRGFGRRVI